MHIPPRLLTAGAMMVLAVLFLITGFFAFRAESRNSLPSQRQALPETPLLAEGFEGFLTRNSGGAVDAFMPIVEDNLFSPDRRPWVPPLSATPSPPPPVAPPPPRVSNIRLYGTQVTTQEKIGLFYFGDLPGRNKHRMLREGEFVWDGEEAEGRQVFQVVTIERSKATLVDSAGRSFDIGLFDHSHGPARGDTPPLFTQQGPTIITSVPARPREPASAPHATPALSTDSPTEPGERPLEGTGGGRVEPPPLETEQSSHPPLIPIQNHEEMEQLVEEGKMRKIMTPFGPIYRPIPQPSP